MCFIIKEQTVQVQNIAFIETQQGCRWGCPRPKYSIHRGPTRSLLRYHCWAQSQWMLCVVGVHTCRVKILTFISCIRIWMIPSWCQHKFVLQLFIWFWLSLNISYILDFQFKYMYVSPHYNCSLNIHVSYFILCHHWQTDGLCSPPPRSGFTQKWEGGVHREREVIRGTFLSG